MKNKYKILSTLLLTLFLWGSTGFLTLQAQDYSVEQVQDAMLVELTEELDGYLDEPYVGTGKNGTPTEFAVIKVPSYYMFDLVRMKIQNYVAGYSDMSVLTPWEKESGVYSYSAYIFDEFIAMVFYKPTQESVFLVVAREEDFPND